MSVGSVTQPQQQQRPTETARADELKKAQPAPKSAEQAPSTDAAAALPASPVDSKVQQGAREMNAGQEQLEKGWQEARRRGNCGRGRCASLTPTRGLGGPPETML